MPSETQTVTSTEFLWAMRQCCSAPECRRISAARITSREPRRSLAEQSDLFVRRKQLAIFGHLTAGRVCEIRARSARSHTNTAQHTRAEPNNRFVDERERSFECKQNRVCSREIYTQELLGKIFHALFTMNGSLCGRRSRANVSRMKTVHSSRSFN